MPLSFPDAPSVNDTYTAGDIEYTWNGTTWYISNRVADARYGAATGGDSSATITVGSDSYTLLTFTSTGTLTVTDAGLFDLLIVGGGAGGVSDSIYCGGGGAGGLMYVDKVYFDANQTVTIGAGGALRTHGTGSVVGGIIAPTGSTGRSRFQERGGGHGSGGGGGYSLAVAQPGDGVTGNDGGAYGGGGAAGGGGGGAGAAGSPSSASSAIGGAGGAGADVSVWRGEVATTTYYAGGGGGSSSTNNISGGIGGGGYGEATNGLQAGGTNTGGGGGSRQTSGTAGAGGSGIVLVRFKN